MGKYFGTDGFRGEANVNLTVEHAYKVGRFLGWYYGQRAKKTADNPEGRCRVAIGKDTRRSSYMFEYSLVAGTPRLSMAATICSLVKEISGALFRPFCRVFLRWLKEARMRRNISFGSAT